MRVRQTVVGMGFGDVSGCATYVLCVWHYAGARARVFVCVLRVVLRCVLCCVLCCVVCCVVLCCVLMHEHSWLDVFGVVVQRE